MTTKRCFYKGCRSIQTPEVSCSETFFQFPKDDKRYELWMTLSKCEDKTTKGTKYLCSKHFDHNKYMSSNPRRKLLLAHAVPYPYQSDDEDEEEERLQDVVSTQFEEDDYYTIREELVETGEQAAVEEEKDMDIQYAESTYNAQIEIIDQSDFAKEFHQEAASTSEKKLKLDNNTSYRKRKVPENESIDNLKILQIRTLHEGFKTPTAKISSNEPHKISKSANVEYTETELITDPNVTTFIFKNEEYVQMPKKLYMDEKLALLKELQYYKNIVTNCKQLLDNVRL